MSEQLCPPDRIPVHCAHALERIADRLGNLEARLGELHDQSHRACEAFAAILDRQGTADTRLTLVEAAASALARTHSTWAGRLWQLAKAAGLVIAGWLLSSAGEPQ